MDINKYSPKNKIKNKSLVKLADISTEEIYEILYAAKLLKNKQQAKEPHNFLKNKSIAIFISNSTATTSLSFDIGIKQMGGTTVYLSKPDSDNFENINDIATIIKNYGIDGAVIFTNNQSDIEAFAKASKIPLINGLTNYSNPCQTLADLFTIWETKGQISGLKIAYLGTGGNNSNSLLIGAVKCGAEVCFACPKGCEPDTTVIEKAMQYGDYKITDDPFEAIKNADIIYTDKWLKNNQQDNYDNFMPYQINSKIFLKAKADAFFMHPLPANRGEEVTEDIIDSEKSLIFQQAENKLHIQKAILSLLFK
jgi:ornithine carbamoyltransferase